jgi:hypothetical protein
MARHMLSEHGNKNEKEFFHEYLLNFFGSILGWAAAYHMLFFRWGEALGLTDLVVIFVAYVGITGYLPHIIINKGFKP